MILASFHSMALIFQFPQESNANVAQGLWSGNPATVQEVFVMIFAGHVGLTLAIAKYGPRAIADMTGRVRPAPGSHTFRQLWIERLDDRALIVGSILPDIVDKPLALFIAPTLVGHSLRNYGHTLIFAILVLGVAIAVAMLMKRQWPVVLALASAGHLFLDMMWYSHRILLWPSLRSHIQPAFHPRMGT